MRTWLVTGVVVSAAVIAAVGAFAAAVEMEEVRVEKYGYALKIPKLFKVQDKIDKTTSWTYQPGSTPAVTAPGGAGGKKKGGIGGLLKGAVKNAVPGAGAADAAASASQAGGAGELQPAVMIYVNWTYMPDVPSQTLFEGNKKGDEQNISSPDPDYKDLEVLDPKKGYAMEGGIAYRYKEVDKDSPDEIHRWHVKAFGNKSMYTMGFTGTYGQFQEWGPVFEEAIKSVKLIPLKEAK